MASDEQSCMVDWKWKQRNHGMFEPSFIYFLISFRTNPSVETQALLRRYAPKVYYFIGTVYSFGDCERVKVSYMYK